MGLDPIEARPWKMTARPEVSPNRRIILNVVASYGRSVFSVLCGLYSMRWVLEALGQVDFGLFGLVSGLVFFVTFVNAQFAVSISRYYAYSVGEAQIKGNRDAGINECRLWFSSAVIIHVILPVVLVAIGYPVGIYALENSWIDIPPPRLGACVWLWRFLCVSAFFGMLNVPFQAMYTAKQRIAELTVYSFAQTVVRLAFAYYMVCHPGDWLVNYGLFTCILLVTPQVVMAVRSVYVFPECRFRMEIFSSLSRIREISAFAWWQIVGGLGFVASSQGMSILTNQLFGARVTGAFSLSQTVSGEVGSLSGALQGAFSPAVISAYGARNVARMKEMVFRVCKMGTFLTLLFAIPVSLEIHELLRLWLKNPPPHTAGMCVMMITAIVIDRVSSGHRIAVAAKGQIAGYQIAVGLIRIAVLPLAMILVYLRKEASWAIAAIPIAAMAIAVVEVMLTRMWIGLSVRKWLNEVVLPLSIVLVAGFVIGGLPSVFCDPSCLRLVVTTVCVAIPALIISWFLLLDVTDREWIVAKVEEVYGRCHLQRNREALPQSVGTHFKKRS